MKTKTKRIINASVWAVIGIVLSAVVVRSWYWQGCNATSLVLAILWNMAMPLLGVIVFDRCIVEYDEDMAKMNRKESDHGTQES